MKKFFDKFNSLKGASFIGIKGYENKYGEVSNLSVVANFDVRKAKERDLATLKALNNGDLQDIADANDLPMETLKVALSELIASGEKNLSENMDERTNQSKAQAEAYIRLSPSVKLHKETLNVFVEGMINSKTVLVEGEYPVRNKRVKTLCKEAIGKHCDLRMLKYRIYNVGSMDDLNITGSTLQFVKS